MKKTIALILAGGRGKRMDILCQERPKPLLPFAGRYRVVDFTLSNCFNSGIENMAALVDHQREAMAGYLGSWSSANLRRGKISILPPRSPSYRGTADAVYQNLDYLKSQKADLVLVLAGDHIYQQDYRKMILFHEASGADATVAVLKVPAQDAHRFGTCLVDPEKRIIEFEEKAESPRSNLASMGIYVFNREYLERILAGDAANPVSTHDFGYAVLPHIVSQDRVFAFEFSGYWQDIGTVEAYYTANMHFLPSGHMPLLNRSWPVFTAGDRLFVPPLTGEFAVTNSLVSPGCSIKGRVENSILSEGVRVEAGARVIDSIVMADSVIGDYSVIDRCILDEGVNIERFCYLGFARSHEVEDQGITLVGKEANVPAHTAIGRNSKVMPGLRLAGSVARLVPPGTVMAVP